MHIPSHKRFDLNPETNRYERRYIVNDDVYLISVSPDKWNNKSKHQISRWLKTHNHMSSVFPYGFIIKNNKVKSHVILENECEFCGLKLKSFLYKKRHMKICKHKEDVPEIPPDNIREQAITNTGTTGNTTNITINNTINNNIQICDFGSENEKWLTKELLHCMFSSDRKRAVKALLRNKHFNDKFPENKNIRIDNKNNMNKRLQVFSKGKWRVRETKPILDSTFIDTHDMICDVLNMDDVNVQTDDDNEDEEYRSKIIKEFQSTERFQKTYSTIIRKWEDFGESIADEGPEFQEYWEYIKTMLLDQNLIADQS